ncbi:hypothetical protein PLICRDRAFT_179922 [Plicaturopsis crispa FD-325 SS-3]|uniref:F-box domain-containing protein n=1 Tax=Plicaturopsis crispa FD-325 SS-3 TaxID=944288 RepID=A0A0C9SKK3_PLICR|nr:hypothetical protein PLICRDRAFT_179922 [Plicaturopsis crispa FD-325 SS-3]
MLHAASSAPNLIEVIVEDARLGGPQLSAFSTFTRLRRLALSAGRRPPNVPPWTFRGESTNVKAYLGILAPQLTDLEISGDLCDLSTLAQNSWPHLRSLIMTGHAPARRYTELSTVAARMPGLRAMHMNFSVYCEGPWAQPPAFIYSAPPTATEQSPSFATTLPCIESLALSNVYLSYDTILEQLPDRLVSLRILACHDFPPAGTPDNVETPRWPRRFPLSEPNAFRIVHRTSCMVALTELFLALDFLPTPGLVRAIAESCPQLRVLELDYKLYDEPHKAPGPFHSFSSMSDALSLLGSLIELHISVVCLDATYPVFAEDGDHSTIGQFFPFVESLAHRMPALVTVWLSYNVNSSYIIKPVGWYKFIVEVDSQGKPVVRHEWTSGVGWPHRGAKAK